MKYIIKFTKTGVFCYTSHLDVMKVFKRAFKRADIRLAYSQGFNPHPKMGFAQPLSLGYVGLDEYIEFETSTDNVSGDGEHMIERLREIMPEGLTLMSVKEAPEMKKTLASQVIAADYEIRIPLKSGQIYESETLYNEYMGQSEIIAMKKQKKKKELVPIDIKPKIREISFDCNDNSIDISCRLDAGSESNLSPELVIGTFFEKFNINSERNEVEVTRTRLYFSK